MATRTPASAPLPPLRSAIWAAGQSPPNLLEALKSEKDPQAMEAVFTALGWLKDPSAIPSLQKMKAASANAKFVEFVDHTIRNIQ